MEWTQHELIVLVQEELLKAAAVCFWLSVIEACLTLYNLMKRSDDIMQVYMQWFIKIKTTQRIFPKTFISFVQSP